jgi:ATP-dependent DNA ligase
MPATLSDRRDADADWIFQRKLDGVRVLADRTGDTIRIPGRRCEAGGPVSPALGPRSGLRIRSP